MARAASNVTGEPEERCCFRAGSGIAVRGQRQNNVERAGWLGVCAGWVQPSRRSAVCVSAARAQHLSSWRDPQGSALCRTSTTSSGAGGPCMLAAGDSPPRCRRCRRPAGTCQKGVQAGAQGVANTQGGRGAASDEVSDESSP